MKILKSKYLITLSFLLIIIFLLNLFLCVSRITYAEDDYTFVINDLKKDSSFNEENYPLVENDYSIKVIQIAESSDNELFVYCYQPSGYSKELRASSINISTTINDSINFRVYQLRLINAQGTLFKYIVRSFTVSDEPSRFYAISAIYRNFDVTIDTGTGNDNTINEVSYAVNKQYSFGTINGNPYCSVVDLETIVITDKFVGFVRYSDGFSLCNGACDAHYVAFNTNKNIDKLLEADVYFTTQVYANSFMPYLGSSQTFGEKKEEYVYLTYDQKVTHNGGGLFAGTYKWNRIEKVSEFLQKENRNNIYYGAILDINKYSHITDSAYAQLQGKEWVLRFKETEYSNWSDSTGYGEGCTLVGDVTILRLKFETDGITYNLGVIDNRQTGGLTPSNIEGIDVTISENLKKSLSWIMLLIIVIVIIIYLPKIIELVVEIASMPRKMKKSFEKSKSKKRSKK